MCNVTPAEPNMDLCQGCWGSLNSTAGPMSLPSSIPAHYPFLPTIQQQSMYPPLLHTVTDVSCPKCKLYSKNPGYPLCQRCFEEDERAAQQRNQFNGSTQPAMPFTMHPYFAQMTSKEAPIRFPPTIQQQAMYPPLLSTVSTVLCLKCKLKPNNPGYPLCQGCFEEDERAPEQRNQFNGSTQPAMPFTMHPYFAQMTSKEAPIPFPPTIQQQAMYPPSLHTVTDVSCPKCKLYSRNPAYPLCQRCFEEDERAAQQPPS